MENDGRSKLEQLKDCLLYTSPDIIPLLDAPAGMAFFRGDDGEFYVDAGV